MNAVEFSALAVASRDQVEPIGLDELIADVRQGTRVSLKDRQNGKCFFSADFTQ